MQTNTYTVTKKLLRHMTMIVVGLTAASLFMAGCEDEGANGRGANPSVVEALQQLAADGGTLTIEDPDSGKSVRFEGGAGEPLVLNMAGNGLNPEQQQHAVELFGNIGGETSGSPYEATFDADEPDWAGEVTRMVFRDVYEIPTDANLSIERD